MFSFLEIPLGRSKLGQFLNLLTELHEMKKLTLIERYKSVLQTVRIHPKIWVGEYGSNFKNKKKWVPTYLEYCSKF